MKTGFLPHRCLIVAIVAVSAFAGNGVAQSNSGYAPLRRDGNGLPALVREVMLTGSAIPLGDVLREIRRQSGLGLVYGADLPGLTSPVTLPDSTGTAAELLIRALAGTRLEVLVSETGQAVIVERRDVRQRADTLRGRVIDGATGSPIAEAEIIAEGTNARTYSDRQGRFTLTRIPDGPLTIVVNRTGYAQRRVERSGAGEIADDIRMQPVPVPLAAVVVTPGTFGVLEETTAARRSLTRAEIEALPQVGEDPFRAVARLPGVVGHDLTANFGVRGSAGRDVLLRLDGVDLIEPFHLKDFDSAISIVDIDAVGGVELMTGGFGAQFGDRTAGVFDMRTATPGPGNRRTTLGLSLTNLRAASSGTFAADRGDWLVSARRGYIDLALKLGGSDDNISPTYFDVLGKVEYRPGVHSRLAIHALWAGDRLSWHDSDGEPDIDSRYGSLYAWLTFDSQLTDRFSTRTVGSIGRVTWNRIGRQVRTNDEGSIDVDDDRSYRYAGIRQELQFDASDRLILRAGVDAQARQADYDYDGMAERFTIQDGMLKLDARNVSVRTEPAETWIGAWLSSRFRPVPALTLEAGARFDRHTHTGDDDVAPRINAAWTIRPGTALRAGWGHYFQAQGLHELQVQDGVREFQPTLRAEHRVIGIEHSFPAGLDARIDFYDRTTTGANTRYINLTDNADLFPELSDNRVLAHFDGGSARGVEFWVRRRSLRGFDWSASWAVARVRDNIDGADVAGVRDQRHALGFDVAYTASGRWRFSAAWQYHSGWPWTPTTARVDTLDTNIWISREYGDYNTGRLPAYHRLDVRASHEIPTRSGRVLMFIDVMNVYGRENARNVVPYLINPTGTAWQVGYSTDSLLPRLPSFGIQWQF